MNNLTTDSAKLRVIYLLERHSQKEVSALTGIPQSTISDFSLGKTYKDWWKEFIKGDVEKETPNAFPLADGNISYDKNGKFLVVGDEYFKGRHVVLVEDDLSSCPYFKDVDSDDRAYFLWRELIEVTAKRNKTGL